MRGTISTNTNPFFNLAMEEYFLKNSDEEHFFLYINEPCIVVGKHQNLYAEINLPFVLNNNIKLARRISGGGTVFHDINNVNFGFIHNSPNPDKINFERFTLPVVEALNEMDLNVKFSERHDLLIDGRKISGNAMHIFKNRVLSHGTILYDSDLSQLSGSLRNHPQKYIDKAIKSVRSKVANVKNYMPEDQTVDQFMQHLFDKISRISAHTYIATLTAEENSRIEHLAHNRYETWDWIYGYSPRYSFQNNFKIAGFKMQLKMQVDKGIITDIKADLDTSAESIFALAVNLLINSRHDYHSICEILNGNENIKYNPTFNIQEFCSNLF